MEALVGVLGFFVVSKGMKEVEQSYRYGKKRHLFLPCLSSPWHARVMLIFFLVGAGWLSKKKSSLIFPLQQLITYRWRLTLRLYPIICMPVSISIWRKLPYSSMFSQTMQTCCESIFWGRTPHASCFLFHSAVLSTVLLWHFSYLKLISLTWIFSA